VTFCGGCVPHEVVLPYATTAEPRGPPRRAREMRGCVHERRCQVVCVDCDVGFTAPLLLPRPLRGGLGYEYVFRVAVCGWVSPSVGHITSLRVQLGAPSAPGRRAPPKWAGRWQYFGTRPRVRHCPGAAGLFSPSRRSPDGAGGQQTRPQAEDARPTSHPTQAPSILKNPAKSPTDRQIPAVTPDYSEPNAQSKRVRENDRPPRQALRACHPS